MLWVFDEALLMSTQNIRFYGEIRKLIPELSPNTPPYVLDKGGYPVYIFLISPRKHMLWVLIRRASILLD